MTKQLIIDEAFIEKLKQQRIEGLMEKEREAEEYLKKLRIEIYNDIDSASKEGLNSILVMSNHKLSQEFEFSIQPLTLKYHGEKKINLPTKEGIEAICGYAYEVSFNL
jgi:hypothetical protein